jgi:plastocyanin
VKPRLAVLSLAAVCAALAVAGCGSSDNSSSDTTGAGSSTTTQATPQTSTAQTTQTAPASGGGGSLKLSADPSGQLKFDTSSLTAKAGKVTLVMDNPSSVPHAVAVEGNGVDKDGNTVQQGGKSTVSVDLKPGKYTFYCPVDGHKDAGMKGTLTVK